MESAEEIIMAPVEGFTSSEKFVWSKPMVLSLIEEYKKVAHEFHDTNTKKKHVWRKIAQRLSEKGHSNVTEYMCDKKWRNLKKTFKEIYTGQRGSPLRTRWGFYNAVEEIFSKDPNIVSAAAVSVSTKPRLTTKEIPGQDLRLEVMEVVGNGDENLEQEGGGGEEEEEAEPEPEADIADNAEEQVDETYDASNLQPPVWFAEFLQQYHEDEERRIEMLNKMHNDIVALEEKKCALLARLVEKLDGSSEKEASKQCEYAQLQRLEPEETVELLENYSQ